MSYFNRIAARTLGNGEQKITPAITPERISETFEIKNEQKKVPEKVKIKPINDGLSLSDSEEKPDININKTKSLEIQPVRSPKIYNNQKNKKNIGNPKKEIPSSKDSIKIDEEKPHPASNFDVATNSKPNEDIVLRELNAQSKRLSSSAKPLNDNNFKISSQKNLTTKNSSKKKNTDTITSESQNVFDDNVMITDHFMKNTTKEFSLHDSLQKNKVSHVVDNKENLSIRPDENQIKFTAVPTLKHEKTSNQEKSNTALESTVTITIGKIEVRASKQNSDKQQSKFSPPLSLTEYLKQREGNK